MPERESFGDVVRESGNGAVIDGQIIGRFDRVGGGEKSRGERALKKKMLINDERSRNVYENKQRNDALSEK
jgi:hypothetical protein